MTRSLCTAWIAITIGVVHAHAQVPGSISAEQMRARLFAFADDSMLGRRAGTPGHTKATHYIVNQLDILRRAGLSPIGDSAGWTQSVPLVNVQLDSAKTRLTGFKRPRADQVPYPVDFVPMLGALGFPYAMDGRFEFAKIIRGGTLGSPRAVKPEGVRGKIVVFLPPLRPDGQPDYQLWSYTDLLATYKGSAAVLIESLELMPRSLIARIRAPWLELRGQPRPEVPLPPIIAVSRAAAVMLEDERDPDLPGKVSFSFSTRREAMTIPSHNILAMLPGSDTTLSREVVVLSAPSDASGTGSIALLAIAEALATSPVKPQRSIVFLWTVGGERGELGSGWFSQHPTFKLDRIVAHVDVGMIGDGQAVPTNAGCRRDAQRLGGRESMELLFGSASHPFRGSLDATPQQIDYARYADATQTLAALVMEKANGPRLSAIACAG